MPDPTEDFTADPVELFFDLAFVLAFSQLVSHLVHHPTWTAAAESALVFLILWLAWSTFTWAANAVQGNTREVRATFLVATAASIPMGASITTAYDSGGGTFAVCASVIILMAIGLQLWGIDPSSEHFRSILKYALPNIVAMTTLVVGGFVDGTPRVVLWIVSMAIILVAMARAGDSEWLVRSGHFAERHGLIVIIALGEVVVAIGISVIDSLGEGEGLSNETLWGLIAAGILAGLLWWAYFDRVMPALEHRNESLHGRDAGQFTRDVYTGLHLPIVGGIITAAAAVEEVLLHPKDPVHTEFLIMLVVGLGLFFMGIAGAVFRAYRALAKERMAGVAAIAALAWIGRSWDGVTLLLVVDLVILLSLIVEHLRVEKPDRSAATLEKVETA